LNKFDMARAALDMMVDEDVIMDAGGTRYPSDIIRDFINEAEKTQQMLDETISECYRLAGVLGDMSAKLAIISDKDDRFA